MRQRCFTCGTHYPLDQVLYTCAQCGCVLEIELDVSECVAESLSGAGVWRYARFLPVDAGRRVSLSEGDTGLHACERLGSEFGIPHLFVKNEGENPTGSFKDRGMTVGVTRAVQLGAKAVACASTGNTAASLSAYAARAGLRAIVLVPSGQVAVGKIAQSVIHGGEIVQIEGNFDDAMRVVQQLSLDTGDVYLLNSINPFRLEGQKTLAYEICESLGTSPDVVVLPMGNAGNISAIWKGFQEFKAAGMIDCLPRMIGVQAENAAPLVAALAETDPDVCHLSDPETVATAIRIGAPVNWRKAIAAVRESGGCAGTVSDAEILAAQRDLARKEGRFVEPASAAPIAWLRKNGLSDAETVVCVATGHGLKDPDAVLREAPRFTTAHPTLASLKEALNIQ